VDGRKESNVEQPDSFKPQASLRKIKQPQEWKLVSLRECPSPDYMQLCDNAQIAADYWRLHVVSAPHYTPDCECLVVLLLNTRRRITGHHLVSIGTLDTILVTPLAVFRLAVLANAAAIVVLHNHPSGDLIRAGQLLKIEVCDHVIMGCHRHCSLKELGYFA
jgi:DNA repair protein RadC